MKTKEEIKEWLMRQDWYGKFEMYVAKEFEKDVEHYLSRIVMSPKNTITGAFVWMETEEGADFWRNVNDSFLKYLNN